MEREELIKGLRDFAQFLEDNPDVTPCSGATFDVWFHEPDARDRMAEVARRFGGEKKPYGDYFSLRKSFGPVQLDFTARRELVCTRKVTDRIQIPATLTPAYVKEIVEWECEPLLAAHSQKGGAA